MAQRTAELQVPRTGELDLGQISFHGATLDWLLSETAPDASAAAGGSPDA